MRLSGLLLALVLSSCALLDSGPQPEDAAADIAAALSQGKPTAAFTGVPDVQQWWDDAVGSLSDEPPRVTVEEVTEDGDTAQARLEYTWSLAADQTWTYTATARLTKKADVWTVAAVPSLIAPDLRESERLVARRLLPPRADILGAGGAPLVRLRPVARIGIDKTKVTDVATLPAQASALAALVGVDPAGYADQVVKAGPKAFVEAVVLRETDVTPAIRQGIPGIVGAVSLDDELPLAPTREFARPILGTVGAVTAEIVEESDGFYRVGDEAGISGLQSRYDDRLRGTPGVTVSAEAGPDSRELYSVAAQPGAALQLTLDERLQTEAEKLLAGVQPASAVVALRPSTGEVLAAASGPGGNGLSTATVGQFAPGSTMKVVSSLALLRAGLTPDSPVDCPATTVVNGKQFKNYDDYPPGQLGSIDLARAVANSCNTAFIGQRDKVDQAALADAAASLGLGVDHDLGYPVYLGSVPAAAGSETEHAASFIGQGKVLASPIAMAAVAASVAAGRTVVPTLVSDSPGQQGAAVPEAPALQQLMRGVVTGGSGVFLGDVPGAPVLAKTGTAEFGDANPPQTHAWMIAVQGDLAVAVFVDVGESGSRTAGPLLEAFLRSAG